MTAHIHRLRRTDNTGQHLLVRIESQEKPLDLKLIGTEHEHLYHVKLLENNVKALQANTYSGDLQEWKDVLKYALLHEKPTGVMPESLQGIETVAAISGKTLTVTLRKNIGGITQRLGSIKLEQDDEREEVSPFDWVDTAVANADGLRTQLETLQASVNDQQDQVSRLTQQLDELVKAKKEHEDDMLKKFAVLLNAKKLKIRDQQRLLSGAKIDPKAAREVRRARDGHGHQVEESRAGKRKAVDGDETDESDAEQESEDKSLIDDNDDDDEEMQQETPPVTDGEATDDGDDLDQPVRSAKGKSQASAASSAKTTKMEADNALPQRELPKPQSQHRGPEAEDDDETDDEL